ncbi:MAG TPA: RsmE family RNA methyltransferase [Acidimicrobiales bacterium]
MTSIRERADAAAQVIVTDLESPALDDGDAHHLGRVLRLRDGERVVAVDGTGSWRLCAMLGGGLDPVGPLQFEPAPAVPVRVWLPQVKGERSEWSVAKLTELGVDEIGLLTCDRAAVRLDRSSVERVLGRWRRVAREASCQSRRVRLPDVVGPLDVAEATAGGAVRCDLDGDAAEAGVTALAVGPEGGWSDAEREATPWVSLGETVLRTETAAIAAGVLLLSARRGARHDASSEAQ